MNKDQVKGASKNIVGKIQEVAGKAVNSKSLQTKGVDKQIVGKVEKAIGDSKENIKESSKTP